MINPNTKPKRPFGVTLAIILCVLFFAIIPSMTVFTRLLVEQHVSTNNTFILPDGRETTIMSGGSNNNSGINRTTLYQQIVISLLIIILGFFAWRGKPTWIRFVFMAIVLIISAILIYQNIILFRTTGLQGGTGQSLISFLRDSNTIFLSLLPLYVIWYLNRAPARAFYRGYYLQTEVEWLKQQALDE